MNQEPIVVDASRQSAGLVALGAYADLPRLSLARPLTLLGSGPTAHLRLGSSTISRIHAICLNAHGFVYIRDLASRTGVFVNGKRVRHARLRHGDTIAIGRIQFRFDDAGPADPHMAPVVLPTARWQRVDTGASYPLKHPVLLIGRRGSADIALDSESVSSAHAILFSVAGRWLARDLGSRTGTFVNDQPIQQIDLTDGDRIRFGEMEIIFREPRTSGATRPEAPALQPAEPESTAAPEPITEGAPEPDVELAPKPQGMIAPDPAMHEALPMPETSPANATAADPLFEIQSDPNAGPDKVETVDAEEPAELQSAAALPPAIDSAEPQVLDDQATPDAPAEDSAIEVVSVEEPPPPESALDASDEASKIGVPFEDDPRRLVTSDLDDLEPPDIEPHAIRDLSNAPLADSIAEADDATAERVSRPDEKPMPEWIDRPATGATEDLNEADEPMSESPIHREPAVDEPHASAVESSGAPRPLPPPPTPRQIDEVRNWGPLAVAMAIAADPAIAPAPAAPPKRSRRGLWIVLILILLAAAGAATWFILNPPA